MKLSFFILAAALLTAGIAHAGTALQDKKAESTVTLSVNGMTCESCVQTVTKALKGVDGVKDVKVSLQEKKATVTLVGGAKTTEEQLAKAVQKAGYKAAPYKATEKKMKPKSKADDGCGDDCCGGEGGHDAASSPAKKSKEL